MSVELNTFKSELTQARSQFCCSWKKETRALSNMLRYTKKIDELIKNMTFFFSELKKKKPEASKGIFVKKIFINTTMGPGLQVDPTSVM